MARVGRYHVARRSGFLVQRVREQEPRVGHVPVFVVLRGRVTARDWDLDAVSRVRRGDKRKSARHRARRAELRHRVLVPASQGAALRVPRAAAVRRVRGGRGGGGVPAAIGAEKTRHVAKVAKATRKRKNKRDAFVLAPAARAASRRRAPSRRRDARPLRLGGVPELPGRRGVRGDARR